MNKPILITSPRYDDGTEYLSAYASEIIKEFDEDFSIKNFEKTEANKINVESYIKSKNPKFLFLNGHGNQSEIYGHKEEVILSLNNIILLKDRITYARACFSANILGQKAVKGNSGCFIGYIYPFSFWMSGERSATPLKDKSASLFLIPSNELVRSLLKGCSAQKANETSKDMMISNMRKLLVMEQKNEPGATGMLQILWGNYEGQVVLGNQEASI